MHNGKTISLKNILWKVMRHPLVTDLNYDDAAMFATEAIELIGAPLNYENKITDPPIKITNYKGKLPDNLVNIRGVKMLNSNIALTYSTDIYHSDTCNNDFGVSCTYSKDFSYTVESGVIKTSFRNDDVIISYTSLPVDDEGYPLVPDNIKVKMAIEYYILNRFLEPLYDVGKITDKAFQRIEQKKMWYMGAANSSSQLAGMDHLESTMNAVNRLLINNRAHSEGFKNLNKKEYLKNHN